MIFIKHFWNIVNKKICPAGQKREWDTINKVCQNIVSTTIYDSVDNKQTYAWGGLMLSEKISENSRDIDIVFEAFMESNGAT